MLGPIDHEDDHGAWSLNQPVRWIGGSSSVASGSNWVRAARRWNKGLPLIASASDAPTVRTDRCPSGARAVHVLFTRPDLLVACTDPLILGFDVGAIALTNRA